MYLVNNSYNKGIFVCTYGIYKSVELPSYGHKKSKVSMKIMGICAILQNSVCSIYGHIYELRLDNGVPET